MKIELPRMIELDAKIEFDTQRFCHPTLGDYVETFWLPTLGPTATLLLRRFVMCLNANAFRTTHVAVVDLTALLGIRSDKLAAAIDRLAMFHACDLMALEDGGLHVDVNVALWTVPLRWQDRWSPSLRVLHERTLTALGQTALVRS